MNPDTLRSWAYAARLSPRELQVLDQFIKHGERTNAQLVDGLYGDLEEGWPLNAENLIAQFLTGIRKKMGDRVRIIPVHTFKMEVTDAVVQPPQPDPPR